MGASGAKHFKAILLSYDFFLEGTKRATQNSGTWFEYRFDGPNYRLRGKNRWNCSCEINILITLAIQDEANSYSIQDLMGLVSSGFTYSIPVYKLGPTSDPENDSSHLGCMRLISGDREKVQASMFGKIRPDTQLIQASVEGHYEIDLQTEILT